MDRARIPLSLNSKSDPSEHSLFFYSQTSNTPIISLGVPTYFNASAGSQSGAWDEDSTQHDVELGNQILETPTFFR